MSRKMDRAARKSWLMHYLSTKPEGVDVLDEDFVNAYAQATGATVEETNYGAHKCTQLGRDLAQMWNGQYLARARVSIPGDLAGMGFPKWVYCYRVSDIYRSLIDSGKYRFA